jgi:hypothetical protein
MILQTIVMIINAIIVVAQSIIELLNGPLGDMIKQLLDYRRSASQ